MGPILHQASHEQLSLLFTEFEERQVGYFGRGVEVVCPGDDFKILVPGALVIISHFHVRDYEE